MSELDPLATPIAKALDASLAQLPAATCDALAARRAKALRRPRAAAWGGGALAASLLVAALSWQFWPTPTNDETEFTALSLMEAEPQLIEDMDMLAVLGDDISDT